MFKELAPNSKQIKYLQNDRSVNKKVLSVYGKFDNHVWPETSSVLEGAMNIQIAAHGHHKILASKKLLKLIETQIK